MGEFFFSFSFFFLNTGFTLILGKKNSEKMSAFCLMILVGISRSGKTFSISSSWVIFLKSKRTYIFKRKLARSVLLFYFKNTGMVLNSFDSIKYRVIEVFWNLTASDINPLTTNITKWPNTRKQFVSCCQQIVWLCLTILWDWRVKCKGPKLK